MIDTIRVCRKTDMTNVSIVVGRHRAIGPEASQKRHYIKQFILHEKYRPKTREHPLLNDIMLIRVNESIQFNRYVKPVCVDTSVFPPNTTCYVTGWGATGFNDRFNCKYYVAKINKTKRNFSW